MPALKIIQKTSIVTAALCGSMFAIAYHAVPHFTMILGQMGIELPTITLIVINVPSSLWILSGIFSFAVILSKDMWLQKENVIFYNFICLVGMLILINIFWFALWRAFFSVSWQLSRD